MAESLTIKINGDTKDFQQAVKGIEAETAKLQADLSAIATKASVAFAGLTATISGLISTYRTQEQAERKLATVLKSTGNAAGLTKKELMDMAAGLQEVTTFGDEATIEAQALLLTFTKIGKDVFPQATESILNMATMMNTDLKSATIMLGKALQDPISGVTALQRAGVKLSETQIEQVKSFSDLGMVAKAQKIILQELEVQFGNQARAAAEGTGRFIQLAGVIGDVGEQIGKHLVPPLAEAAQFLKEAFGKPLKDKNETLGKVIAQVLLFSVNLAGLTAAAALTAKTFLTLRLAFIGASTAALTFNKALKGTLAGLALTGAAALLTKFLDNFRANMKKAGQILESFGMALLATFVGPFTVLKDMLFELPEIITNAMMGSYKLVEQGFETIMDSATYAFETFKNEWKEFGKAVTGTAKETKKKVIEIGKAETEEYIDIYSRRFIAHMQQRQEFQALVIDKMGEEFAEQMKLRGEFDEIFYMYDEEQRTKLIDDLSKFQLTKEELEKEAYEKKLKRDIKEKNDELIYQQKHNVKLIGIQKAYYNVLKLLDSQRLKDAGDFASEFNQMANSKNKELRAIAKIAANVQIVANTAEGASSAMAKSMTFFGPIAGPVIGATLAAAQVAFGVEQIHRLNAQKLADGGVVTGGIPGVDSVPAMLMPGELVVPTRNFDEVVGAVGGNRDADIFGDSQSVNVAISFEGDEASQVLTAHQIEDRALGVSREEVA